MATYTRVWAGRLHESIRVYGPLLRDLEKAGLTKAQAAWWILRSVIRFDIPD